MVAASDLMQIISYCSAVLVDMMTLQVNGHGKSSSEILKAVCEPWASLSAQYSWPSFSRACYPCCTQENPIPNSEQSQGESSAQGCSGFLFLLGLSPVVFQGGEEWSSALVRNVFQLFSSPVMEEF